MMQTQPSTTPVTRSSGVVWALLLITLGIVLLLNNLGVLPWSIWSILVRLWPVLLVALGVDLLLGRDRPAVGIVVATLVTLLIVGVALIVAIAPASVGTFGAAVGATRREAFDVPLGGVDRGDITLSVAVARVNLHSLAGDSPNLLHLDAVLPERSQLERSSAVTGRVARISLAERTLGSSGTRAEYGDLIWDVGLAQRVPLSLNATLGVGQSTLDLTDLNVEDLRVRMGVGETTINLPASAVRTDATVDGGVGHLVLIIPPHVGARIQSSGGLGTVNVDSGRFAKDGNVYQTQNYETATNRADITLHLGVGSVDVR